MVGGSLPIPAIHTDFPLAALGEELGLIGVLAILGLYLVIIERGLRIAAAAADDFRALLAAGLALVVGVQAFIIAAGNLKLIPLTGITLPFISYGGSSLLANAVVVGLLLALSDRGVEPPPPPRRSRAGSIGLLRRGAHERRAARPTRSATPIGRGVVRARRRAPRSRSPSSPPAPATGRSSGRPISSAAPDDPLLIAAARNVVRGADPRPRRARPGDLEAGRQRRAVPGLPEQGGRAGRRLRVAAATGPPASSAPTTPS